MVSKHSPLISGFQLRQAKIGFTYFHKYVAAAPFWHKLDKFSCKRILQNYNAGELSDVYGVLNTIHISTFKNIISF